MRATAWVVLVGVVQVACSSAQPGGAGGGAATGGGSSGAGGGAGGAAGGAGLGGGAATGGGAPSTDAGYLPDPVVTGNVLHVCPQGCTYALPSAALAAAVDGDTVQVDYGSYTDCAYVTKNNLIIRGVSNASGQKPKVGGKVCGRKGIFVVQSANVLIENLELADAVDPTTDDENWACVRFDSVATARNLKLRDCALHDADNGLLGNNTSTAPNVLVIEGCTFERLGRAGYAHGMYVGEKVDLFVLRNSVVRDNHDDGHLVKSRALANIIECNTIAGLEGSNSFAIDLPQGGQATLRHNVVEQGPHLNNSGNYFVNFAQENGNNAPHALTLHDNRFINDYTAQGRVNIARTPAATAGWAGNTYVGAGSGPLLTNYTGPTAFTSFATRAAAGLPAFDGGVGSLPARPVCP